MSIRVVNNFRELPSESEAQHSSPDFVTSCMHSVIFRFTNSPPALCICISNDHVSTIICFCCVPNFGLDIEMWLNTNINNKILSNKNHTSTGQKMQGLLQLQNLILLVMDLFFAPSEKMNSENSTETSHLRLSHYTSVRGQNVWSAVNLAFSCFEELYFPT